MKKQTEKSEVSRNLQKSPKRRRSWEDTESFAQFRRELRDFLRELGAEKAPKAHAGEVSPLESGCVHNCSHCWVHGCGHCSRLSHISEQVRQRRDSVKHNQVCCCHCWWRTFVIFGAVDL